MSIYLFEKPLIRGTMLERKSQFTALVDIDGEEVLKLLGCTPVAAEDILLKPALLK